MNDRKFWMVWRMHGNGPTRMHDTKTSAINEAERLASNNPGFRFVVLEAICAREVNNMREIDLVEPEEVPF